MATLTYLQAISAALRDELRADERVLLMGEDIGVFGGAFKVTDGFIDEFGPDRVMDTPLAESGIIGTASATTTATRVLLRNGNIFISSTFLKLEEMLESEPTSRVPSNSVRCIGRSSTHFFRKSSE